LIIDALAALALATEPPHVSILKTKPVKRNDDLFTKVMWRQILGIALYMVLVLALLTWAGSAMFGL